MDRSWATQLKKGLTEMAVLAALRSGESYGYELLQRLERTNILSTTAATLYPILARLADEKLIAVREAPSPAGPVRRYYRLTAAGRKELDAMLAHWSELVHVVGDLAGDSDSSNQNQGAVA
jgi:PadR family transcriptional regulator PadR